MLPLLSFCLSLPISSCMHAWRRKKRGWRGSAYVAACLFVCASYVGASVGVLLSVFSQGGHQLRARQPVLLLSESPGGRSAASARPPPDWVRGEETPHRGRCKPQWGFRKNNHTCTNARMHAPIWAHTFKKSPRCETNRLLMLQKQWWVGSTSIQHELIITSLWSCLERSGYTPIACISVCVFVSECQTHCCVSAWCCLFLYISTNTNQPSYYASTT